MKKSAVSILALVMMLCMLLSSCGMAVSELAGNIADSVQRQNDGVINDGNNQNLSASNTNAGTQALDCSPKGEYNEGVVLVKYDGEFTENVLAQLDFESAEPLYAGSQWHTVKLGESADAVAAVKYLTELGCFEKVDYDYVMKTDAEVESVDISGNSYAPSPEYLETLGVKKAWIHSGGNANHAPGGVSDVVIAVIDTGVDYNHLDLRNNIWVNPAEIPDNGKDDDGNGYIDDIYGWDCVGNDKDPMDDNGHGTHVAGIIAAENNKIGTVGIAYNCKVMVLKAGNSSGYFNNSDIVEAIQYAYMNGASVINMSFGGSNISVAAEEALENAYNTCVLVAAAGNDSLCNNLSCPVHAPAGQVGISYPAALPYVIGVMSCDQRGNAISNFSNFDHFPGNSVEYEVYAPGEAMPSTWPGNKYANLNGTSMAAPTVSGIAALLRSYYPDREAFSTKFLQSQIVNTGKALWEHNVANAYDALVTLPKPAVSLYDYEIDDSVSISAKNNGNGVIDAGETVRLRVSLMNRGGVASNVNVSIDTDRGMGMTDPYFTFVNPTMQLSDIGTYSVRESGDKYFEIVVDANCPNDYLVNFNIRFTYTNGLDTDDKTVYEDDGRQQAQFNVSSGYHLPSIIDVDTVFTNDRLYIVGESVLIAKDVTVTFEEGCRIQFYADQTYYDSPVINVYGTLIMEGTKDNMITINPSERYANLACIINDYGTTTMNYVDAVNLFAKGINSISNSNLKHSGTHTYYYNDAELDSSYDDVCGGGGINATIFENNYVEFISYATEIIATTMNGNYIVLASSNTCIIKATTFTNNIVYSIVKGSAKVSDRMNAFSGEVSNNKFLCEDDKNPASLMGLSFSKKDLVKDNYFSQGYLEYANQIISGYYNSYGEETVNIRENCSDISALYPHIVSVEIYNADGEQITTIGKEEITVRVTFNKAMDTTKDVSAFFGTIAPYADYKIEGAFVSETEWVGTYSLKAYIENGLQFMQVKGACAADDATKTVHGENQLYVFNIDTTAAMAMNLFANATDAGIELTWAQDDYATLMGYNIYRATSKDGNYVKINPSVLLASASSFIDDNAEPGVTYWYTFTVVLSDFSESKPAGKVYCTAIDTINPSVYHTPVNQGYQNNNLVISCTASDNMKIASVTLYYRTVGATEWKSLTMSKVNDKYSATVFGSELTLEGLEYYIVASDGSNTVNKGSTEVPYFVVIKDASAISRIGDVDGDGVVTTKDALMLMQAINEERILTDDEFKRADLNGDGTLNSAEALRILQYINGNVTTLEM